MYVALPRRGFHSFLQDAKGPRPTNSSPPCHWQGQSWLFAEIMAEQAKAFGDKAMSWAQVYDIVKKVKNSENMEGNRGKAINKFVRTEEMINDVKRFIEEDRRVDVAPG